MRRGTIIELTKADPRHECAYVGQRAKVWRVNKDGSLYVELKCGHPYTFPAREPDGYYKVISEPEEEPATTRKESKMPRKQTLKSTASAAPAAPATATAVPVEQAKQAVIPDGRGVIPVQGYEEQVKEFKTNLRFFERLGKQIDAAKDFFRSLTDQVLEKVSGEVSRVEFLAEDGSVVPVTLPDPSKAGNRTLVKPELISEVIKLGVSMDELAVTESETVYVLTGGFAKWFEDSVLVPNYVSAGLPIPDEIDKKVSTRLSEAGIKKLQEMATSAKTTQEREAAKLILKNGIKAAQVTAK